jgi:glucosyl-dolichyl phosphate glucuronosyltransferase
MHVTVILCTYNRSENLSIALTSAAGLVLPDSVEWEVLVVDNNSADQTRNVVERFCKQYPGRFRYLFEAKPGKSNALNAGIRDARGDILAFMDDDVTLDPMWLQNLTAALRERKWAGVTGRILWQWNCPRPRWLSVDGQYRRMSWPLTSFDLGEEACDDNKSINGANMAFRKDVFAKYGGFRTDLGPQPGNEIRCEDTEFGLRLHAAGERVGYEPSAIVYHPVSQSRLTRVYFLAWWFDFGCATVRRVSARHVIWGLGPYLRVAKMACRLTGRTLQWILALGSGRRFYHKVSVWEAAGALVESYRQLVGATSQRPWMAESSRAVNSA